jgi:hypothetical protein
VKRATGFLISLAAIAACGGDDGGGGPGDVAAVFPDSGFLGRKLRVEVSGNDSSWDAQTTVSFGDKITVDKVEVISPQAMFVDLTIAPDATAGKRDVVVTDGGDTLTLAQSFDLQAPVTAAAMDFEQGGFGLIELTNLDLLNPFDTTQDADGNFTNLTVTNGDPSVTLTVVAAAADSVTLSATIDVLATTTGAISLTSTREGVAVTSPVDAVAVTARTPVSVTAGGTPASITVSPNGALLEITAATAGFLHVDMKTDDPNAFLPGFIVIPASGKFSDALITHANFGGAAALDNRVVAAGDKFFLVALEFFGSPGYMATFSASTVSLTGITPVADTGDNNAKDKAQALTGTVAEFDGALSDVDDTDCFKIPMAANKKMHVFTTDENGASDTVVTIFSNDLAAGTEIAASDDADFGEDIVSPVQALALTRSACVTPSSASPDGFMNAPYKAFVVIE